MPRSYLWAIDSLGKVYGLASNSNQWEELRYYGVDFKRVASVQRCMWAIGGDHQLYLYVLLSDVPIRFKEVAYENERWNPRSGFSHHLLPTDRPRWSSQDGLTARPKEKIKLPTLGWEWEGDWSIEDNLEGQPLGHEGWMYAFDFPMTYGKDKKINSFVRRRKWVRYRRYTAVDKWSFIPSIHVDPVFEPFIDISVGGLDVPGGDNDTLAVWAVTVQGRVMFRHGVTHNNPDGDGWIHVSTPQGKEINHVSVGSTGLVWAITWDGKALVRVGVTRFKIAGCDWVSVASPLPDCPLLQISVGADVAWATCRDGSVWLRKGIKGSESGESEECATGNAWVKMVGELSVVSVGPNDQVWALNKDEPNTLCYRDGITTTEAGGKIWKPIMFPVCNRLSRVASERSISSKSDRNDEDIFLAAADNKTPDCARSCDSAASEIDSGKASSSFDGSTTQVLEQLSNSDDDDDDDKEFSGKLRLCSSLMSNQVGAETFPVQPSSLHRVSVASVNLDRMSISSSGDSPKHLHSRSSSQGSVALMENEWFEESHIVSHWCWLSGSGCHVDPDQLSYWLTTGVTDDFSDKNFNVPWRNDIMDRLGVRNKKEFDDFSSYEHAVEKASWTKKGKCLLWTDYKQWVKCNLELEQLTSEKEEDSGVLICYYQNGSHKMQINLNTITCIMMLTEPNKTISAIYTADRTLKFTPIRLSFASSTEMQDWIAILSTTCCYLRAIPKAPHPNALWAVTKRGDVFTHNVDVAGDEQLPHERFWQQTGGHLSTVESCPAGVVWGIGHNYIPWVHTKGWGGGLFQGLSTSTFGIHPMTDVRRIYIYENQRWNPLSGFAPHGLPTDRYMWSDRSGRYECTKENTRLPSIHWQWIRDWSIDFHTPGGVDKEGWQYAKDFPMSYHGYKGLADYVRRRRWYRKCKLTTSGPWKELESVPLIDISFQVDHSGNAGETVGTWAIDVHGNVLFRHNVTGNFPSGDAWEHVSSDQKFISISAGANHRIWAVAQDGSAYFRNGVHRQQLTGNVWFHVEPPAKGCCLRQISAGATAVWAVDDAKKLWHRQEIMPMFPEGTCWKCVCSNVCRISVGPNDEAWAVLDSVDTPEGTVAGVVACRKQISCENPTGTDWEYVTGGGWSHVTVRGHSTSTMHKS